MKAFVFPGQGAHLGMGMEFVMESSSFAEELFEQAK